MDACKEQSTKVPLPLLLHGEPCPLPAPHCPFPFPNPPGQATLQEPPDDNWESSSIDRLAAQKQVQGKVEEQALKTARPAKRNKGLYNEEHKKDAAQKAKRMSDTKRSSTSA